MDLRSEGACLEAEEAGPCQLARYVTTGAGREQPVAAQFNQWAAETMQHWFPSLILRVDRIGEDQLHMYRPGKKRVFPLHGTLKVEVRIGLEC